MNDVTIPVTPERLRELLEAENEMESLRAVGVDNWEGWGEHADLLEDPEILLGREIKR